MGGACYLSMGLVVLLMGLVFASVYIYRYFFLAQVRPGGREAWRSGKGGVYRGLQGGGGSGSVDRESQVRGAAGDLPPSGSGCPAKPRNPASSRQGASLGTCQPMRPLAWSRRWEQSPVL